MSILPSLAALAAYLLMPEDTTDTAQLRPASPALPACAGTLKACLWCALAVLAGLGLGNLS